MGNVIFSATLPNYFRSRKEGLQSRAEELRIELQIDVSKEMDTSANLVAYEDWRKKDLKRLSIMYSKKLS